MKSDGCWTSYSEKRFLISPTSLGLNHRSGDGKMTNETFCQWGGFSLAFSLSLSLCVSLSLSLQVKLELSRPAGLLLWPYQEAGGIMQGAPPPCLSAPNTLTCSVSSPGRLRSKFNHNFKDEWTWSVLIIASPNCGYINRSDLIVNQRKISTTTRIPVTLKRLVNKNGKISEILASKDVNSLQIDAMTWIFGILIKYIFS